ncbi:hypothetical protein [Shouchella patagoniensis]|uniref:hypothetical protein n=1 Tax=Shouchella patagoniensis TaxID=228576 RepID=UPI000995544E|nr:hypothetical protein [Shouchella patagoniensis]
MFIFIGIIGIVQLLNGGLLWVFGYPSIYATYLAGFHTKKPDKWFDYFFNLIFWLFISVAYLTFIRVAKNNGFLKTRVYYGFGYVIAFFLFLGVIMPVVDAFFPE